MFEWVGITIVQYQGMSLMYRNTISASMLRHSLAFSLSDSYIKWLRCVQFNPWMMLERGEGVTDLSMVSDLNRYVLSFIRIVWGGRRMSPIAE